MATAAERAEAEARRRSGKAEAPAKDGAKPGAGEPDQHFEYNADAIAKSRESADITIGGTKYHRRKKNWEVTRELRTLLRTQERCGIRIDAVNKQLEAADVDAADEVFDELYAKSDELADKADTAAYGVITLLLADKDGNSPEDGFLREHLDVEDVAVLARKLQGGREADPTQTTPST